MAYVNVAEWSAIHVGDWLLGLDDSILPYVQFFVNKQINGCRLLLLTPHDLDNLNIFKIGHQEIILEAVELLRQLHYNFGSEILQTIALRLACKSRALFNQLKHAAAAAAAAALANSTDSSKEESSSRKDNGKKSQPPPVAAPNGTSIDLSPVSTSTLSSVSDILAAVKDFISWIDRYPFDGQEKYIKARKVILQLSIELASTAQRDQFVQGPNEVIRQSCKKLADLCDRLVQELNDSLAMQSATLEVVTVSKGFEEELGMHIHSSYSGIHVVGGLKYHSPAHLNGNIEEGDEIIQVNYQTVVGWQLKKLVSSMRQFPTKLTLTVKKRPRHHGSANFTLVAPFPLPIPEVSYTTSVSSQRQQMMMNAVAGPISTTNSTASGGGGGKISSQFTPEFTHYCVSTGAVSGSTLVSYGTIPLNSGPVDSSPAAAVIRCPDKPNGQIGPSSQYEDKRTTTTAKCEPPKQATTVVDTSAIDLQSPTTAVNLTPRHGPKTQKKKKKKVLSNSTAGENNSHSHQARILVNRIATTRCSSASDSSSYSLSDVSTLFSSDSSDNDSDIEDSLECKLRQLDLMKDNSGGGGGGRYSKSAIVGRKKDNSKMKIGDRDSAALADDNRPHCTSCDDDDDDEVGSEEEEANDNDSAFYSGPRNKATPMVTKLDGDGGGGVGGVGCAVGKAHYGVSSASSTSSSSSCSNQLNFAKLRLNKSDTGTAKTNSSCGNDSADSGIRIRCDEEVFDGAQLSNTAEYHVSERKGCISTTQPRTSAEFEALYLRKNGGGHRAKASTLPPNTQPNVMSSYDDSAEQYLSTQAKACNTSDPTISTTTMTSIQLSTITHLTSLAKNIRFANTTTVDSVQQPATAGHNLIMNAVAVASAAPHAKSKFDGALANRINEKFQQLTNSDMQMGNHEDFLYFYKGSEHRTNSSSPTNHACIERVPSVGSIIDKSNLHNWTKIRVVLKDNCLYSYSNNSSTTCFELPVHLPGYYILVDKSVILEHRMENNSSLFVFKLVTYHRLFMFAVESLSKLALWIVRFGYRFCCNPNETQLCFTYYLSPAHVNDSATKSKLASSEQKDACKDKPSVPSRVNASLEVDSSDYHELIDSESSESFKDIRVKFDKLSNRSTDDTDDGRQAADSIRRFIKSPHPRGSARFAVKPKNANQEFIDSIVDPKKTLEENLLTEVGELPSQKAVCLPELPPRSSSNEPASATENTTTNATSVSAVPRPKPRISKMCLAKETSSMPDESNSNPVTTTTTTSLVSHHRLAPIPVPEKSAAISQTIQHFANLQKQNNLRRSFQQAQTQKQNESRKATAATTQAANPDYDYITNKVPVCYPPPSAESSPSISNLNNTTIDNPLYSQLPMSKSEDETKLSGGSSSDECQRTTDEDDTESGEMPLSPPSIQPPPPPVVRTFQLKTNPPPPLSLNEPDLVNRHFNADVLSSPRIQTKRKKHIAPPPPLHSEPEHISHQSNESNSPPVLLPRRSRTDGSQIVPPPLPKTSHPALSKSNSSQSATEGSEKKQRDAAPPLIKPKPDFSKRHNGKLLNRSLSDAAYSRQANRHGNKQRKSLESSAAIDLLAGRDSRHQTLGIVNDDEELVDIDRSGSTRSSVRDFAPLQHGGAGGEQICGDTLNTSNRSLPTMGVSMLGKKRLSNVSADCFAIEKAIALYHHQQQQQQDAEDLRNGTEWDQIENTLLETHQRLLN